MTRNGKIARLPRAVRELINQRLADGEPGKALVAWLNGLPEVVAVLDRDFGGRGITEQNLSEWRQGGWVDWQRHQESLEWMRTAAEQAEELAAEAGAMPLTDVLSGSVTLLLAKLIQEAAASATTSAESRPEARGELLGLIREWTALRKTDHKAVRLKMAQIENRTESDQIRPNPTAKKASNGTGGAQAADHGERRHSPTEAPGPHPSNGPERTETRAKAGIQYPASFGSLRK